MSGLSLRLISILIVLHLLMPSSLAGHGRGRGHGRLRGRNGNRWICPPGFKEQPEGGCRDINECTKAGPWQCGQLCINTLGSYRCSCLPGYSIGFDEWSCSVKGAEPKLIYSHRDTISELSIQNVVDPHQPKVTDLGTVLSLDIHHRERALFWIDRNNNRIDRRSLDGGETQHVVSDDLHQPEALAIDWVQDKIYWTDFRLKQIERCDLNGSNREVVFNTGKRRPKAIAVDPFEEVIFWSVSGKQDKIERVSMNGGHSKRIAKLNIRVVRNLAVDVIDKRLYWLDSGRRMIESTTYNGRMRKNVIESVSPNAFGLAIFEQRVYWVDSVENTINSVVKYGQVRDRIYWSVFVERNPHALCINHPSAQPTSEPTLNYNCTTSSDCAIDIQDSIPEPSTSHPFLVFANTTSIHRVGLDGSDHMTIASWGLRNVTTIEYDPLEKMVYFADSKRHVIERVGADGRGLEVVASRGVSSVEGMAIDWMHRRLYWVDSEEGHIATQSLYLGSRHTILLSGLDEPHGIAVHPDLNIIYWSSWGNSPRIEAAKHDGSNRVIVAENSLRPTKLAIDYARNKVLWVDAGRSLINEADLDGSNHRVFNRAGPDHPFGLALYGDLMWTTDPVDRQVLALDRNTGAVQISMKEDWIRPVDVHVIHNGRRVIAEIDPCLVFNGGCEQICIRAHVNQAVCSCETGYHLSRDKVTCEPDECYLGLHNCHPHAHCTNTPDGFRCTCQSGYIGDGFSCVAPTTEPQKLIGAPEVVITPPPPLPSSVPTNSQDGITITTDGATSSSSSSPPPPPPPTPPVPTFYENSTPRGTTVSSSSPSLSSVTNVTANTSLKTDHLITSSSPSASPTSTVTKTTSPKSPASTSSASVTTLSGTSLLAILAAVTGGRNSSGTVATLTVNSSSTVSNSTGANSTKGGNMTGFFLFPVRSTLTPPTPHQATLYPTYHPKTKGGHLGDGSKGNGKGKGITPPQRPPGHFGVCPLPFKYYCLNGGSCTYLKALEKPSCECTAGFAGERCQFTDKRITKGINMKTVTAVSAGVLAPLFLVLVITALLCYWRRARAHARSKAYNVEFVMSPDYGNGSLPKKTNIPPSMGRLNMKRPPLVSSVSQVSTQSEPPTRSPPKPPSAQLQNCYSDPCNMVNWNNAANNGNNINNTAFHGNSVNNAALLAANAAPISHHYYKVPRNTGNGSINGSINGSFPPQKPKPSLKPKNLHLSSRENNNGSGRQTSGGLIQSLAPSKGRSKFPLMERYKSKTMDTAYLTPKEFISDLPSSGVNGYDTPNNRTSAYIDVNDTKIFLPGNPLLNLRNKLSRTFENVYQNMPKASTTTRSNIKY